MLTECYEDVSMGKKRPSRTGVAINLFLSKELSNAMGDFLSRQKFAPTKTAVVSRALREYFIREGVLEGEKEPSSIIPHFGPIAAGQPVESFDNPPDQIDLVEELGGEGRVAFIVRGDSMVDERIYPGDTVIVRVDPEPKSGEIVVACVDGSLTLKRLVRRGDSEFLAFCNDSKPVESRKLIKLVPERGDRILGKFVAVYRKAK